MSALAESRVLTCQSQETRKPLTSGWQSVILGQYRRHFSVLQCNNIHRYLKGGLSPSVSIPHIVFELFCNLSHTPVRKYINFFAIWCFVELPIFLKKVSDQKVCSNLKLCSIINMLHLKYIYFSTEFLKKRLMHFSQKYGLLLFAKQYLGGPLPFEWSYPIWTIPNRTECPCSLSLVQMSHQFKCTSPNVLVVQMSQSKCPSSPNVLVQMGLVQMTHQSKWGQSK